MKHLGLSRGPKGGEQYLSLRKAAVHCIGLMEFVRSSTCTSMHFLVQPQIPHEIAMHELNPFSPTQISPP
jgi:hypothetical protein